MSYGEGETYTTSSQVDTDDQYFAELASAGVTVFASSGDDGSTPGANGSGDESGPVQVESPASDPNVTGVGGTTLVLNGTNGVTSETVWNENGGASGGGVSIYFNKPVWQTGTGVNESDMRQVPDVAASASEPEDAAPAPAAAPAGTACVLHCRQKLVAQERILTRQRVPLRGRDFADPGQ